MLICWEFHSFDEVEARSDPERFAESLLVRNGDHPARTIGSLCLVCRE